MTKKRILILGAGVSGLAAAWELSKKKEEVTCVLLEKGFYPGGWMSSSKEGDFVIEKGPRVFKTSRNQELLALVEELGCTSSLIPSSKESQSRYLWLAGRFQKMPTGLCSFLCSKLTRPLLLSLLKEKNIPPLDEDETIWDFTCRRLGEKVAEQFIDPFVSGIYAGESSKLSIEACLPLLKTWEKEHGSLVKGAFSHLKKRKKKEKSFISSPLFSFQGGTSSLMKEWISKIPFPLYLGEEILSLKKEGSVWKASSAARTWEGDEVILALPSHKTAQLLKECAPHSAALLKSIVYEDVTSLSIGWKEEVLPFNAFGYLVPSIEKEPFLGVLFDSMISNRKDQTLITAMIRGVFHTEEELRKIANRIISGQLKIAKKPDHFSYQKMGQAIPQYHLGHKQRVQEIVLSLEKEAPSLFLTGNYVEGVSVSDSIRKSKQLIVKGF